MNKKQTLGFMIVMFLVGGIVFTTADLVLSKNDLIVELSKTANDKFNELGINNPQKSECVDNGRGYCEFKMWKDLISYETQDTYDENGTINGSEQIEIIEKYNLGTHKIPLTYCSEYEQVCIEFEKVCNLTGMECVEYDENNTCILEEEVCLNYVDGDCLNYTDGDCLTYVDYTQTELEALIENKSREWMENYANVLIKRENNSAGLLKVGAGDITTKEITK